jgi:hypothetical protein
VDAVLRIMNVRLQFLEQNDSLEFVLHRLGTALPRESLARVQVAFRQGASVGGIAGISGMQIQRGFERELRRTTT